MNEKFYAGYAKFFNEYRRIALFLKNNPNLSIELQMASDNTQISARFLQLSAAQNYFVHKFNINPSRISVRVINEKPSQDTTAYFLVKNPVSRSQNIASSSVNTSSQNPFADLDESSENPFLDDITDNQTVFQSNTQL